MRLIVALESDAMYLKLPCGLHLSKCLTNGKLELRLRQMCVQMKMKINLYAQATREQDATIQGSCESNALTWTESRLRSGRLA